MATEGLIEITEWCSWIPSKNQYEATRASGNHTRHKSMNLLDKVLKSWKSVFTLAALVLTWHPHLNANEIGRVEAVALTTELMAEPLGLDVQQPRFSWKLRSEAGVRGQFQTGYRLLVATAPDLLKEGKADIFDSKQIPSGKSVLMEANGLQIQSRTRYYWSVKLWDETKKGGSYSQPASFETGILNQQGWFEDGAKWIESPMNSGNNEEIEDWAKYVILRLKYHKASRGTPTAADFEYAMKHYHDRVLKETNSGAIMRREFDVNSVKNARLYITGLGYYRAYLNGQRIGDRDLAPSDSHFFANVYYQVFDVTNLLKNGNNCLGVELVNGRWKAWFGNTAETYSDRPVLMARLELTDAGGHRKTIVTDEQWRCGESPLLKHGFWIGELYDARKEHPEWKAPGFNAEQWIPARVSKAGKKLQHFTLDPMPPEKTSSAVLPVRQTEPKPLVYVYDFGKMIGGRARFTFHGLKTGQRVTVRYAECIDDGPIDAQYGIAYYDTFDNVKQEPGMLKFKSRGSVGSGADVPITLPDGSMTESRLGGGATAYLDRFVSAGRQDETWVPDFTYTGFRYLEVLGLDAPSQLDSVSAYDLHTTPEFIGTLSTDNPKLNRVLKGIQDTLLSCFHSQLQDNNGAERNPNAMNIALNDANTAYWINVYPLWRKVAFDTNDANTCFDWAVNMVCGMRDSASKKARKTNISNSLQYGHLPYNLVAFYDDQKSAKQLLPWTLRFVKEASEYMVWNDSYGSSDHIAGSALKDLRADKLMKDQNLTSPQFFKSGYIIRIANMAAEVAEKLGDKEKSTQLHDLTKAFESKVVAAFYDEASGQWTPRYPSCQGRNTTLMYCQMQPRADDHELSREIVDEIQHRTNGHQITGSRLSYPLLHELSQNGFENEAFRLLMREEYPSLLEMIDHSGGTIRESWGTADSFAQIEGLTAMGNWFYADLVGINPDLASPAFARFCLKPIVPTGVHSVEFAYESPRGKIESRWKREKENTSWDLVIPPNSIANIAIPTASISKLQEGGAAVSSQKGIVFLHQDGGRQIYQITSGHYHFAFPESSWEGSSGGVKTGPTK